jgi:hypothetical protein
MTVIPIKREEMADDSQYTRLVADLLGVARGFCDYGEEKGLLTPDGLKFAVTKRKEIVKQLADAGKSCREIAELVGVGKSTIDRDLNGSVPKRDKPAPNRDTETIEADDDEDDNEEAPQPGELPNSMRVRGFLYRAKEAAELARADDLTGVNITEAMRSAAADTAQAWIELLSKMEGH